MNLIAQQALARALGKALPAPTEKPQQAKEFVQETPTRPLALLPDLVITGPINTVMRAEGRRCAVDVVLSAGSTIDNPEVVAKVIHNLTMTAISQPSSCALGMKDVIDALKSAI